MHVFKIVCLGAPLALWPKFCHLVNVVTCSAEALWALTKLPPPPPHPPNLLAGSNPADILI